MLCISDLIVALFLIPLFPWICSPWSTQCDGQWYYVWFLFPRNSYTCVWSRFVTGDCRYQDQRLPWDSKCDKCSTIRKSEQKKKEMARNRNVRKVQKVFLCDYCDYDSNATWEESMKRAQISISVSSVTSLQCTPTTSKGTLLEPTRMLKCRRNPVSRREIEGRLFRKHQVVATAKGTMLEGRWR